MITIALSPLVSLGRRPEHTEATMDDPPAFWQSNEPVDICAEVNLHLHDIGLPPVPKGHVGRTARRVAVDVNLEVRIHVHSGLELLHFHPVLPDDLIDADKTTEPGVHVG